MNKNEQRHEVAVWDTFVHKADGSVMHFDILVPTHLKDHKTIFEYGKRFAEMKGEMAVRIDVDHCQFCHVEFPPDDIEKAISNNGYYILEMDDIPSQLPTSPTRRDIILHLKAHYEKHRFTNFSGVPIEEIQRMILLEEQPMNNPGD